MADTAHILILDDDIDVACAAQMLLRRRHGRVATLDDPARLSACWKPACRTSSCST
jgi:DNA-binding NtrC family response regulator